MKKFIFAIVFISFAISSFAQFDREYSVEALQQSDEAKTTMGYNLIGFQRAFIVHPFYRSYDAIYDMGFLILLASEESCADLFIDYKNMSVVIHSKLTEKEREYLLMFALHELKGDFLSEIRGLLTLY
jgi:hypothetical protein